MRKITTVLEALVAENNYVSKTEVMDMVKANREETPVPTAEPAGPSGGTGGPLPGGAEGSVSTC